MHRFSSRSCRAFIRVSKLGLCASVCFISSAYAVAEDGKRVPDSSPIYRSNATIQDFAEAGQTSELGLGTVDATDAFDRALSAGSVDLPCGTYRFNKAPKPITASGRAIRGVNAECVKLVLAFPAGDGLQLKSTSWALIEGLTITTTTKHNDGAGIHLIAAYGTTIRNVVFTGLQHDMVVIDGANTTRLIDSDLHGVASHSCISIVGHSVDTYVSHTNLAGCGNGILITHASGVQLDNMDIVSSIENGVLVQPGAGEDVNALFANQVWSDTSGVNGWAFVGSGPITEVYLSNGWASGSINGSGLVLDNKRINGFSAVSFHAHHNHSHGIDIEGGQHITIGAGSHIVMNGCGIPGKPCSSLGNTYNGINVAANVSDVSIIGVFSGAGGYMDQDAGYPNKQGFGLFVARSSANHIVIADNNFHGNSIAGASIGALGSDVLVRNNTDYRTEAAGSGNIEFGQTSVIINSHLAISPKSVQITPANDWHSANVWVEDITPASFRVVASGVTRTGIHFTWHALALSN